MKIKIDPNIYPLTISSLPLPELLTAINCDIGAYAHQFTTSPSFPFTPNTPTKTIRLIQFDGDYLTPDILAEIKKNGFELPSAQDALLFALQYPDIQKQFPIAFLHTPWIGPTGGESVLILRCYADMRFLHMHLFDSRWYGHIRFAVVEK